MKPVIISSTTCDKPWVLVLGRKRRLIEESMRLEHVREMEEIFHRIESLTPDAMVVRFETVQLFIGNRLFGTVIIEPKKRYSRFALRVFKPTDRRKPFEVHVTKRLIRLEAEKTR